MSSYASGTNVSEDKSRMEIEQQLQRSAGKDLQKFAYMTTVDHAEVMFQIKNMTFRMRIFMPKESDFRMSPSGRQRRSNKAAYDHYLAERRRRWRSLCMVIKAKLVAIADQVATFEEEFLPYMVTDDGQTIADRLLPAARTAASKQRPLALPSLTGGES